MDNEKELFQQIKEGNKQSFEKLFRYYYAPLCHFSRKYIADADECEEVVQGFFLKVWEKRMELDINTSVKNYLFSSVRNRCLNYIKHQKIKLGYKNEVIQNDNTSFNPDDYLLEVDLQKKIREGIDSLPARRKEIFLLSRDEGLKYREIADRLGISIKTVETQMGQALKDLREKLSSLKHLLLTFFISLPGIKNRGNAAIKCQNSTNAEFQKSIS
ncbi:MAG: RNA polymerase sigma-70 factor [Prolixibacteraceae bacterium]|nr:RNA polymerase sigma-70 factor [Prolixibacteraceae bacterium]